MTMGLLYEMLKRPYQSRLHFEILAKVLEADVV